MRGILIDRFLQGIFAKTSKTIKNKGKNKMDKKLKKTPQIDAEFFSVQSFFCAKFFL